MPPATLLTCYCLLILLASLAGGWVPIFVKLTHLRLQLATSFVAGLMLGVGLLHMLPHAAQELNSVDQAALWLLVGFLFMFITQRFLHFHHHDVPEESPEGVAGCCDHDHVRTGQPHRQEHPSHTLAHKSASQLSWGGAAMGLTLHTLINGVALAASVEAVAHQGRDYWLMGFGTFLVIILHKPFDALTIVTLMTAGGWSRGSRHLVNGLFALVIPIGVLLFHLGAGQFPSTAQQFLGAALAFASGTFVCIAASDLLPELQFHSHDRIKLSVALLAGLLLSALIGVFESSAPEHHAHTPPEAMMSDLRFSKGCDTHIPARRWLRGSW
jgi:zinc and cadmium transporter